MRLYWIIGLIILQPSLVFAGTDPYDPFFDGVDNSAQVNQLQNRLDRLDRDMLTMQKAVYGKSGVPGSAATGTANAPQISTEIQQLQEQIQALTGRIEVLEHRLKQAGATSSAASKAPSDNADSTQDATGSAEATTAAAASSASASAATSTTASSATATPAPTPAATGDSTDNQLSVQQQFQTAFEYVKKSDFPNAQKSLTKFIADNAASPQVSNAYFWLGEIAFIQKKYEDAAVQYLKGYKTTPRGAKAADSLYKLTLALEQLKNKPQACKTLTRLDQEFPDMSKNLRYKAQEASKQLGCAS